MINLWENASWCGWIKGEWGILEHHTAPLKCYCIFSTTPPSNASCVNFAPAVKCQNVKWNKIFASWEMHVRLTQSLHGARTVQVGVGDVEDVGDVSQKLSDSLLSPFSNRAAYFSCHHPPEPPMEWLPGWNRYRVTQPELASSSSNGAWSGLRRG